MFSCELCKIFKNSFFYRTPLVATSVNNDSENREQDSEREGGTEVKRSICMKVTEKKGD